MEGKYSKTSTQAHFLIATIAIPHFFYLIASILQFKFFFFSHFDGVWPGSNLDFKKCWHKGESNQNKIKNQKFDFCSFTKSFLICHRQLLIGLQWYEILSSTTDAKNIMPNPSFIKFFYLVSYSRSILDSAKVRYWRKPLSFSFKTLNSAELSFETSWGYAQFCADF